MQRRLTLLNLALTTLLVALVVYNGRDTFTTLADRIAREGAVDVVALPDPEREGVFHLFFDGAMAAPEALETPLAETPVSLEPATPVSCRWVGDAVLEVRALDALRRATTFRATLAPGLRALDGRPIAPSADLVHRTPGPRLLHTMIADEEDLASRDVVVTFDLPIDPAALARAMRVEDAAGQGLGFTVGEIESQSEHAYRVRVAMPDGGGEATPRLRIVLDPGLRSTVGDLPLGRPATSEVVFEEALRVEGIFASSDGIEIRMNRRCPLPDADFVALEPATPHQIERSWRGIRLVGSFPPGEALDVILRDGFPGPSRFRLAEEVRRTVRIPNRPPSLDFARNGQVLSARARPEIEVTGTNVPGYRVRVRPAYGNNLVRLAQESPWASSEVFAPALTREFRVTSAPNETFVDRFDLADVLGGDAYGVHLVEIEDLEGRSYAKRRLIQVTDLGVTARWAGDTVAVQVASLATGRPVPGASIRVFTPTNQNLVAGTTDARGTALLPFDRIAEDRVPYLVLAEKGGDAAYVDLDGFGVELADETVGGRAPLREGFEAYVAPDRGAVRPGEALRAVILLREATGAAPAAAPIEVRWLGPDRRVRSTERRDVPPSGLLVCELPTTGSAPTGRWTVEIRDPEADRIVGSAPILVDAFVPDRLEASVRTAEPLRAGRAGAVRVAANWLEGGAASGRPVRVSVRFDPGKFEPSGFEGFSFEGGPRVAPPGDRPVIRSVLDDEGSALVRFEIPVPESGTQVLRATVRAEVEDPSGRPVLAGLEEPVLRANYHLGIRPTDTGAAIVLVTPEGGLFAEPTPVRVQVERRRHEWERVPRRGGFTYECEVRSEVVAESRVTVEGGSASVALDLPDAGRARGWRVVVARAGDRVAEAPLDRVPDRPDRLRVSHLGTRVAPGTTADLSVECPVDGIAFVSLEGERILSLGVVPVTAGTNTIPVRIPDDACAPNLHAVVTLRAPQMRPGAVGPFWLAGAVSIPLSLPDRVTDVRLTLPEEVKPETEVTVEIAAPGATSATLALVDEGILRRTRHRTPDPAGFFLAERRLESKGADLGTSLLEGARFDPGVVLGFGDGDGPFAAPRLDRTTSALVETVALFEGPFPLDAEGRARVTLRLPPYEGRLRAMAVAAGSRCVGGGDASLVVRGPIGLRLAGPRIVAPGDRTTVVATVRNATGEDRELDLMCEAIGGAAIDDPEGAIPTPLVLRDGETASIAVPVRVGAQAQAQGVRFAVASSDLHREASLRFEVRVPGLYRTERVGLAVDGRGEIEPPGPWAPGTVEARLILDTRPESRLLPALDDLIDYPYGCAEQITSRAVGLLACRTLLRDLREDRALEAETYFAEAVDRLLALQTPEGGIAIWPGDPAPDRAVSVYVLDLLVAASERGIDVPRAPVDRLAAWVLRALHDANDTAFRCWAVDALSRHGTAVGSWASRLSELPLSPEDRVRLASVRARAGDRAGAMALLDGGGTEATETPAREASGLFRSAMRLRALELRARLEADPGDPRVASLAEALMVAVLRPSALTTHEKAHVLLALGGYFEAFANERPEGAATVRVFGEVHRVDGRVVIPIDPSAPAPWVLESDRPVLAVVEMSGIRPAEAIADAGGLTLARAVIDVDTGGGATAFRRGGIYEVRIEGIAKNPIDNLLLTDTLPGGFEIDPVTLDERLSKGKGRGRRGADSSETGAIPGVRTPSHVEIRDDRVLLFDDRTVEGTFTYVYRMRAVFPGGYVWPAGVAEALYDPGMAASTKGEGRVEVAP